MRVPLEPRRPHGALGPPRRAAPPSGFAQRQLTRPTDAASLQRAIGNQAFGRLLAVQRVDAQALAEFRGYVADGDWARAAWVLDTWAAGDIARQVRAMPVPQLESLVEGAWHGGKNQVVAAVKAVNARAAIVGAVRVLVWSHRWDEAVEQLEGLGHKDAIAFSKNLLAAGRIDEDQLKILIRNSPNLQFNPGDAVKIGPTRYVVYVETVRYGGTFAWRNNNPGNLTAWPGAHAAWGSIGLDDKGFLIFPEASLGKEAIGKNLRAKARDKPTILGAMEEYAPRGHGKNDPDAYAAKIVRALGGSFTVNSLLSTLTDAQFATMVETIVGTEGTVKGEEVPHDSKVLPLELLERLTPG